MGPMTPEQMGAVPVQVVTTYVSQPYGPPAQAKFSGQGPAAAGQTSAVMQVSHTESGETAPKPNVWGGATIGAPTVPGAGAPDGAPDGDHGPPDQGSIPVELAPSSHPPYTVAPPDILYLDSLRLIPRPPYLLEPLDQLQIVVSGTLTNQPINGIYTVGPDGTLNLGFSYGTVRVAGLTVEQAQAEIRRHLVSALRDPQVVINLIAFRGVQQTRGEHLVRQDGTISLGTYGSLYVAGLTLGQIKCLLEQHLSKWFLNPQVSVDVAAYNSKFYYVITDGGGFGQSVIKLPITGNEYVLDAIANIQGLAPVASKRRIWVSRPAPCGTGCYQILPVDWRAITEGGDTCTNYQLFPGDRVFVHANRLIELDNWLSMIYAPIERTFGVILLGNFTVQSFRNNGNGTNTGLIGVVGR
jgi:polysaccharide export outer membrane protein